MLTKKQIQEIPLFPMKEQYSYTRYRDGSIVPEGLLGYSPKRLKYEFIPNQGYVPKMRRK